MARVQRTAVDLSGYPELVIVYLGLRVTRARGVLTLLGLGPQIDRSWKARPDGLLLHENLIWSLLPPHLGMRQYWRDLESLEAWTRSDPHREWWLKFMRDTGGTAVWHEAYFMGGGIDAIFNEMSPAVGLARFAPTQTARGQMFSSRARALRDGEVPAPVVAESELYGPSPP